MLCITYIVNVVCDFFSRLITLPYIWYFGGILADYYYIR